MADVVSFLSRQLKRSRDEVNTWGTVWGPPSEEDKLLLHELLKKYENEEGIQNSIIPMLTPVADGTYEVQPHLFKNLLILLLKKEHQEGKDKLNFENFRVMDAENQNKMLREQLKERDERIAYLQRQNETTEQLRRDLETQKSELFSQVRQRQELEQRVKRIAEELRQTHENKMREGREKAGTELTQAMESMNQIVSEVSQPNGITPERATDIKRRLAEVIDTVRLVVAINF